METLIPTSRTLTGLSLPSADLEEVEFSAHWGQSVLACDRAIGHPGAQTCGEGGVGQCQVIGVASWRK